MKCTKCGKAIKAKSHPYQGKVYCAKCHRVKFY